MVNVVVGPRVPYGASNWPVGEAGTPREGGGPPRDRAAPPWVVPVGGAGVPDVQQERGSADTGALQPVRVDAERVRDLDRARRGDRRDAVDVLHGQASVGHGVACRLDV